MNDALPAITEPTGAPSPFERQTETESKYAAYSFGAMPVATHRVPKPCPVEVEADVPAPCERADVPDTIDGIDCAAGTVVRILQADEARLRHVVQIGPDRAFDLLHAERPALPLNRV
jgi:hypothetical protein